MDVALQLLQLLTVYSRMHADAPIKSRDKSLWVYTDYSLTHIHRSAPARGGRRGDGNSRDNLIHCRRRRRRRDIVSLQPKKRPFDLRLILI